MKTILALSCLCAVSADLFAQRYEPASLPAPQPAVAEWGMKMQLFREDHLRVKLESLSGANKFVGAILADIDDQMVSIPGLPPLLETKLIAAVVIGEGGAAHFDFGPAQLPFTVYLQGVGLTETKAEASAVDKVEAYNPDRG